MNVTRTFRRHFALLVLVLLGSLTVAGAAAAHDVRPAYLQIDKLGQDHYSLLWRTPLLSGAPLPVVLSLPEEAKAISPPRRQSLPGQLIERRAIQIPGGLAGKRIGFVGLEATITDVMVRVSDGGSNYTTTLVRPSRPWIDLDPNRGKLSIALTYLHQGIEHILFGIDHLLFIVSLLLIVRNWRMLLMTVTAFTVAHSITLALATFGLVRLPPGPLETLIAASIVLVAVEAVRRQYGTLSFTTRWPWVVAFAFGLLHGFGFAGALQELGLPQGDVPLALLAFNLGVEIGQLIFIAVVLAAILAIRKVIAIPQRAATFAACYTIGITASFWVFERLYSTLA